MATKKMHAVQGAASDDLADARSRSAVGFFKTTLGRSLLGLGLLLLVGGLLEPRTVTLPVLLSMLPFAAILGVASIGQHLVIQQRGFDLSVVAAGHCTGLRAQCAFLGIFGDRFAPMGSGTVFTFPK